MNTNIKLLCQRFKTSAATVTGFSLLIVLTFCSLAEAQKFDIGDYLKKKDTNRDGKIEESEMSDNIKGILKKMKFDTSKPVSISKIISKVDKDKKALAKGTKPGGSNTAGSARQVPGFGVEAPESATVARFVATESSSGDRSPKFSERVMERVGSTLEKFDHNKNGSLDQSEIKNAKWGSQPPGESDTNHDGTLSREELANRFTAREQYFRGWDVNKSESDQEKGKKKQAQGQAKGERGRKRGRQRFRNSSTSSTTNSAGTTSGASSGSSAAGSQAKYQKYVDSLIGNYDKDKDGKLSKDEAKEMRRPPVGADADKDGFITQSELLNSLSGANKNSATNSAKPEQKAQKGSPNYAHDYRNYSVTQATRTSSSGSPGFDKLDSNLDRHIQMHEFSDEWDDGKVTEFYEKDKNGDGVITLGEWSARN